MKKVDIFIASILITEAVLVVIIALVFMGHNKEKFRYLDSAQEAIENTNSGVLAYYDEMSDNSETMMISPLCIQSALYLDYISQNKEDVNLFKAFNNGYKSWADSGFHDKSFSVLYPESEEALQDMLGECTWQEDAVYAVCRINDLLDNAYTDGEYIYCTGTQVGDNIKISLGDYDLWLNGVSSSSGGTEVTVKLNPFKWQAYGKVKGLLNLFESDRELIMFCEFGISNSDYNEGSIDDALLFDSGFDFFIVNKGTGLIVLCGRC